MKTSHEDESVANVPHRQTVHSLRLAQLKCWHQVQPLVRMFYTRKAPRLVKLPVRPPEWPGLGAGQSQNRYYQHLLWTWSPIAYFLCSVLCWCVGVLVCWQNVARFQVCTKYTHTHTHDTTRPLLHPLLRPRLRPRPRLRSSLRSRPRPRGSRWRAPTGASRGVFFFGVVLLTWGGQVIRLRNQLAYEIHKDVFGNRAWAYGILSRLVGFLQHGKMFSVFSYLIRDKNWLITL